ncbi:MAG: hypothetical protein FJ291_20630 [Planctomycetes bacterium]|nr:hypothetical protein [Planctomycetota bacterium]
MSISCETVGRLLSERAFDEANPERRADILAHLAACRGCRDAWSAAYDSQELEAGLSGLRGTASVRDRVMARLRGEARPADGAEGEPPLPARVGGFEVLGTLGRGGMGTVLKARQTSTGRIVALKVLPRRLARDERFVTRFIREAFAAARLRHPHIVQVYDAGLADGYYYFAMEYVDGEGLDKVLARGGPLEPGLALRLMRQVCGALQAAHEAGIIHRDIKPSNILLDSQDCVRVTDFGLAKHTPGGLAAPPDGAATAGQAPKDATATAPGHTLGTPAYLAPEVAAGGAADARSDLYSLGATFFHVLVGRPPFEGASLTELVLKQRDAKPPRTAEACRGADPRLCRLIDRLLSKRPDDRPASAEAVLGALDAIASFQPPPEPAGGGEPRQPVWDLAPPTDYYSAGVAAARREARRDTWRSVWLALSGLGMFLLGVLIIAIVLAARSGYFGLLLIGFAMLPVGVLRLFAAALASGGITETRTSRGSGTRGRLGTAPLFPLTRACLASRRKVAHLSLGERSPTRGGRVRVLPTSSAASQAPSPQPSPRGRGGRCRPCGRNRPGCG